MNYKSKLLGIIFLFFAINLTAQDLNQNNTDNQIIKLNAKVFSQQKAIQKNTEIIKSLQVKLHALENQNSDLSAKYAADLNELETKTVTILNDYNAKISAQEKEIADLKASLHTKNFSLYLYIALALIIALVLFVYFMKLAINKAITQQGKNWSDFLTHIVKR